MRPSLLPTLLLLLLPALAGAETQLITLTDGEEIYGTIAYTPDDAVITDAGGAKRVVPRAKVAQVRSLNVPRGKGRFSGGGRVGAGILRVDPRAPDREDRGLPAPGPKPGAGSALGQLQKVQMDAIQTRILTDPKMMQAIMKLASKPELVQLLQDPTLLQAITQGDLQKASAHPSFQKLASDPTIRALMEQLKREMGPQR